MNTTGYSSERAGGGGINVARFANCHVAGCCYASLMIGDTESVLHDYASEN